MSVPKHTPTSHKVYVLQESLSSTRSVVRCLTLIIIVISVVCGLLGVFAVLSSIRHYPEIWGGLF